MERNTPQHKVDAIRSQMSIEERTEFDDFCKFNRNTTAIRQLLEDWGYKVSQSAVQNWYKNTFPVGSKARVFNQINADFSGIELQDALQKLLVINANLIDDLVNALSAREGFEQLKIEQLLISIPSLSREVRACAAELQQAKFIKDKKSLEIAGAYRAIQELKSIFSDTPFEKALDEASRGVLARIEDE